MSTASCPAGWPKAIVAALIETFADHPHPKIYQGDAFQQLIDAGKLTEVVKDGHRARPRPAVPGAARRDRAAAAVPRADAASRCRGRSGPPTG